MARGAEGVEDLWDDRDSTLSTFLSLSLSFILGGVDCLFDVWCVYLRKFCWFFCSVLLDS